MFGLPLTFDQLMQALVIIGAATAAIGYGYRQFTSGSRKADTDLIATLTQNLDAQKAINDSLQEQLKHQQEESRRQFADQQEQINRLTMEIGRLQGEKAANDQKIKEYLQLISNRNPELERTLAKLEQVSSLVEPFMAEVRQWHEVQQQAFGITPDGTITKPLKRRRTTTKKTTEEVATNA